MSKTLIQPYLFFSGRCDEALEFYKTAIGAEVTMLMRYDQSPEPVPEGMLTPGFEKKVMHSSFNVGESIIMASDGCGPAEPGKNFNGFSLSLTVADEAAAKKAFDALGESGEVQMPLTKTFWSPCFGMLTDRFGMGWMITIPAPGQ
jgi:PhnB protein